MPAPDRAILPLETGPVHVRPTSSPSDSTRRPDTPFSGGGLSDPSNSETSLPERSPAIVPSPSARTGREPRDERESPGYRSGTSLIGQIGHTPLLRLHKFEVGLSPGVELHAKAEWFNPGGSVKDRPALAMILDAEERGVLTRRHTIMDPTSGNTGIAYAMIARCLGYRTTMVMPASASTERRSILAALGCEVLLTDALEGGDGAIEEARRLAREEGDRYFMPDQYSNPANWRAHFEGTALEILEQTGGRVTHFVAGMGTTGTLVGTGRRLKAEVSGISITGVQPDNGMHGIEGLKHLPSSLVPAIYDPRVAGRTVTVTTDQAWEMTRRLALEEGLFVGPSSGAALVASLTIARELEEGVVVTIFPDSGARYLSVPIWR